MVTKEILIKKETDDDIVDLYINDEWLLGTGFQVHRESITAIITSLKIAYEAGKEGLEIKFMEVES